MDMSLGTRWQEFVQQQVRTGRYRSATDVVQDGLRLVEERDAKLNALRDVLEASIARGGRNTGADLVLALDQKEAELAQAGL